MATCSAADSGYVTSNGGLNMDDSDAYVGSPSYSLVGVFKFTKSINSILGTSATSWSQLNVTAASLAVKCRDAVIKTGYQIGISKGNPSLNVNNGNVAGIITGVTWGGTGSANASGWFNILSLFQKLSASNTTVVTPNTATWYIFIKNTGCKGANRRFARKSQYDTRISINGGWASNLFYSDGSTWTQCIPYYWDGTAWKQCMSHYWDGTAWKQT